MKTRLPLAFIVVTVLLSISCGLTGLVNNAVKNTENNVANKVLGQGNAGTVAEMWPDVPKMDGMTQENLDLPIAAKLAIQAYFKANTQNDGTVDFIAFTTSQAPSVVASFYTTDKMKRTGWNETDQPGCLGSQEATVGGNLCIFGRRDANNKGAALIIFSVQDDTSKKTQVFFIRIGLSNLPTKTPQ